MSNLIRCARFAQGMTIVALIIAAFVLGTSGEVPRVQAQDPEAGVQTWDTNGNNIPKNGFLGTTNNRPLVFKTNNGEQMRILPNGNVGIGTNNPQAKIHTVGAGEGLRVQGPAAGAANGAYVSWSDSAGTAIGYVGDGSSGDTDTYLVSYVSNVHLYTPFGAVLTAGANGRVGIGSPNPSATLDI